MDFLIILIIVGWLFIWRANCKRKRAEKVRQSTVKDGRVLDLDTGLYRSEIDLPDGDRLIRMEVPHPLVADYDKIRRFICHTYELAVLNHYLGMCREMGASAQVITLIEEQITYQKQDDQDIADILELRKREFEEWEQRGRKMIQD